MLPKSISWAVQLDAQIYIYQRVGVHIGRQGENNQIMLQQQHSCTKNSHHQTIAHKKPSYKLQIVTRTIHMRSSNRSLHSINRDNTKKKRHWSPMRSSQSQILHLIFKYTRKNICPYANSTPFSVSLSTFFSQNERPSITICGLRTIECPREIAFTPKNHQLTWRSII